MKIIGGLPMIIYGNSKNQFLIASWVKGLDSHAAGLDGAGPDHRFDECDPGTVSDYTTMVARTKCHHRCIAAALHCKFVPVGLKRGMMLCCSLLSVGYYGPYQCCFSWRWYHSF
ncbi:MAG: hypothetical protein U0074_02835 [Kouleothrix sp.]